MTDKEAGPASIDIGHTLMHVKMFGEIIKAGDNHDHLDKLAKNINTAIEKSGIIRKAALCDRMADLLETVGKGLIGEWYEKRNTVMAEYDAIKGGNG